MRLKSLFLTAGALALAGVTPTMAATITWNNPGAATYLNSNGNATTTLQQLITGTEVFGACAAACSTTQTISDTVNNRTLTFAAIQFTSGGYGFGGASPSTGIPALNAMTQNGGQGGSGTGSVGTTITGLTVGQAYSIQVFFWFPTGNNGGEQINGTSFVDAGSTDPSFATGSFIADASTEALSITGGTNNNLSTILVTQAEIVPEPASLALLAASLLGFGVIRRGRAARVV